MLALLALLLGVDGGTAVDPHAGIVEFGASRAGESWGPAAQPRVACDLRFDEKGLKVTGALTAAEVRATALKYQGSIEICAAPFPQRSFTLTLQVRPTGGVDAMAHATPADAKFDDCMTHAAQNQWIFPKKSRGSQVVLPLQLSPQ